MKDKAVGTTSLVEFAKCLTKPRAVWLMVPVGAVDQVLADLLPHLERGYIVVDGGNSYYIDDIRRAKELAPRGIHTVDVGTSGSVSGLERGYCMMIGENRSGSAVEKDGASAAPPCLMVIFCGRFAPAAAGSRRRACGPWVSSSGSSIELRPANRT